MCNGQGPVVSGLVAGSAADRLLQRPGSTRPGVRRAVHTVASAGPALALLPLALPRGAHAAAAALPVPVALACLTAALALQGCNYAGFHSYVQVRSLLHLCLCSITSGSGGTRPCGFQSSS